jgi:hypothetical protein
MQNAQEELREERGRIGGEGPKKTHSKNGGESIEQRGKQYEQPTITKHQHE